MWLNSDEKFLSSVSDKKNNYVIMPSLQPYQLISSVISYTSVFSRILSSHNNYKVSSISCPGHLFGAVAAGIANEMHYQTPNRGAFFPNCLLS